MRFGRKMTAAMRPEWGPHVYVPYEALKRTPNLNPNPNPTLTLTPAPTPTLTLTLTLALALTLTLTLTLNLTLTPGERLLHAA